MSSYLHRLYEGRFPVIAGYVYEKEELPDITTVKEGTVYNNFEHNKTSKYYKAVNGEWVPYDGEIEYRWRALQPLCEVDYKPSRARFKDVQPDGTVVWKYYESEDFDYRNTKEWTNEDGIRKLLQKQAMYVDCGGAIRDEYISVRGFGPELDFKDRGFPVDMTEETREAVYGHDGKFTGWDATWVTMSEWSELHDKVEDEIIHKLREAYEKEMKTEINKKLDFIIRHMKEPLCADVPAFYKSLEPQTDEEGNEYGYDSPEYIKEEYFPNLYCIASELGKAAIMKDFYGIYGDENFRIIYFIA